MENPLNFEDEIFPSQGELMGQIKISSWNQFRISCWNQIRIKFIIGYLNPNTFYIS